MNKDVIYIEPEDDITDIITKIENSKKKVIALVPPKKASVFRSIVNLKLVAKAGAGAEKSVVIVTSDPSIVKLAAAVKLPVTKDLKSAPVVPKVTETTEPEAAVVEEEVVEEITTEGNLEGKTGFLDEEIAADEAAAEEGDSEAEVVSAEVKTAKKSDKSEAEAEVEEEAKSDAESDTAKEQTASKEAKTTKKPTLKSNNPAIRWIQEHKKIVIAGGVGVVVLIIALIWGFVIAPAAEVTVGIRTTATNFSENVSFTEKLADENASEGVFYLEEKKLEEKAEVEFTATGKKNVGDKASGTLTVNVSFPVAYGAADVKFEKGDGFTYDGKTYLVSEAAVVSFSGSYKYFESCINHEVLEEADSLINSYCVMQKTVKVVASESGTNYNTTSNSGWSGPNGATVSAASISGGTDQMVTVVQQSDVDKAKQQLESGNANINKQKLLSTIADDAFIINASFKETVGEAVARPAVGEEVKDGDHPMLSVTTTDTIYIIDSTKVEEFIREKARLAENFKIYEMNDPFIENFIQVDGVYVAKLKTSYVSGPKITEAEVAEVIKGKGVGTARQDLEKAYDGISKINIQTNYPWVSKVPNDNNKITVNIEVDSR